MVDTDLEIFLPVHNEAGSIEHTITEIYGELSKSLRVRFIVCEDGSTDGTQEILRSLAARIPLRLNSSASRRGYSRAVRDGMEMVEADYLLCLDSDGQCDPKDFWQFWENRRSADVLIGWRTERQDALTRRTFSRFFYLLYQAVFRTPFHDPSCPYVLLRSEVAHTIGPKLGAMQQGLWWEFVARVWRTGAAIRELPVHHRLRASGKTQVYKWNKMPGIFLRHVAALFRIKAECRQTGQSWRRPLPAKLQP